MTEKRTSNSGERVCRLLIALRGHALEGLSNGELAKALGESPSTIHRAMNTLIDCGLAISRNDDSYRRAKIHPLGYRVCKRFKFGVFARGNGVAVYGYIFQPCIIHFHPVGASGNVVSTHPYGLEIFRLGIGIIRINGNRNTGTADGYIAQIPFKS